MKNSIILLMLGCVSIGNTFAQKVKEADVPTAVKSAFTKAYPKVKNAKWSKEDGLFEASFDQNKMDASVTFNNDGSIKEIENEIAASQLPSSIKNVLAKEYADYKVNEAAKIEAGGVVTYEAEVKKGKQAFDFIFDISGKLLKKVEAGLEKED